LPAGHAIAAPDVLGSFLQGVQAGQGARQAREQERRERLGEAEVAELQVAAAGTDVKPVIDTGTAAGLAQACAYMLKIADNQWAPASQDEAQLAVAFALECKGS
jgi:hypothetical protein